MIRGFVSEVVLSSLMLLVAGRGYATGYYVSLYGDDRDDGLTEATAWRTITHAAQQAQAGDTVYIKAGDYRDEHVVIANSGCRRPSG